MHTDAQSFTFKEQTQRDTPTLTHTHTHIESHVDVEIRTHQNHNFTSVFADRTSFRAKVLQNALLRWHRLPP